MLTEADYKACQLWCFQRSWRVRLTPIASRRLIRQALELMALSRAKDEPDKIAWVTGLLAPEIAYHYTHPYKPLRSAALIWLLLQIILPVIVRLVIKWWEQRSSGP